MSLEPSYFESLYAGSADPWGFRSRFYEQRKRALTLASLPAPRFGSAFEPGCSFGLLTAGLARRCDRLLATDVVPDVVAAARRAVADQPHVRVEVAGVPAGWPEGVFDLIVLSELGYYLGTADLADLVERLDGSLSPEGVVVACHWRHPVEDYPLTGDDVHEMLLASGRLAALARHHERDFRLDVLVRPPVRSVAQREGLLP